VTFHNPENGFCVLRVKARGQRDPITLVGHAAMISAGEFVQASSSWINDRTHGVQVQGFGPQGCGADDGRGYREISRLRMVDLPLGRVSTQTQPVSEEVKADGSDSKFARLFAGGKRIRTRGPIRRGRPKQE
jgi:hypothetical protein